MRGPRGGIIMMRKDFENPFGLKDAKGNMRMMSNLLDMAVFPGTRVVRWNMLLLQKQLHLEKYLTDEFTVYAKQVVSNAQAMAKAFVEKGYKLISNGTDNHLNADRSSQ